QTIYYGSRRDGLFRSDDAGLTWRPIDLLPRENTAINFVQFDPTTGGPDGSRVLYVGLSRASDDGADVEAGIYRSTDGGTSFHKLFVPPRPEAFGTVDHQGNLFLHRGRLLRWTREQLQAGDFTPQDLTPPLAAGRTLYSVDIDPNDPNRLITGTIDGGDPGGLFYSRDGGKTWRSWMNHRRTGQGEPFTVTGMQPYDPDFGWVFACMHQATFDRADPRRAFFTGWYTIGAVDDLDAERVTIRQLYQGIEMTCIWDLICPPQGAPLISGLMDLGGFVHDRVDELPASYLRGMGPAYAPDANPQDVNDLDFCEADPSVVVATIGWRDSGDIGAAGYSTDGGKTWRQFPTLPFDGAKNGRIAISATNPDRIVFVPRAPAKVYFTHDRGKTWQESKGGPADIVFGEFVYTFYMPLGSDRVDGSFYLYDRRDGRFFRSEDGAAFEPVSTLPRQSGIHTDRHVIKAMPHAAGHVFAALNEEGLHRSTDGGRSWTKLDGVARAWALGFGRIDDSNRQAVYIVGRLSDDNAVAPTRVAVYRSDDLGESWVRLNEPDAPGLAQCITLEGDQQTPGRIYIGENGRGIWRFDETK
ncbi:MAG TPA: hypothetical protein PKB10_07935, partial [Tepidisphaeraceae bacterium]|nr:hypothetical protein [Tepidisphaeraceae bacterium]